MKPETSATLKLIAFGLFLICLIFIGLSVPFYLRQRDVLNNWVSTEGQVLYSNVVTIPLKHGTNYDAHITVEYRLGTTVVTKMINSGYPSRFRSHAEAWVSRYPAGTRVTIAYNPLNPTDIRLDPGYNRYFFAAPLLITEIGGGFGIVALILFLISRRGKMVSRGPSRSAAS